MTVLRDVLKGVPDPAAPDNAFTRLVDEKAWQHLGLTGDEFRRQWYAGAFRSDPRPYVRALDALMRTGHWEVSPKVARYLTNTAIAGSNGTVETPKWSGTPIGDVKPVGQVRLGGHSAKTSSDSLDGWISKLTYSAG